MHKSVIIIDDDEIICGYCSEVLKSQFDFEVDVFYTGYEALENANEKQYSLIFTDLFLPDISGFELIPKLISKYGQVPIIVISGLGSLNDAMKALRLGAYDYINKPFSKLELELVVKRVIDKARALEERLLLNKEILGRIQIEKELALARKILTDFLPGERVLFSDFTFMGMDFPSRKVGGDFYNYFWLDENRFVFLIGDVSGSGVPAALVSGMVKLAIDSVFQFKPEGTPAQLMKELNSLLFKSLNHKTYISMFIGIMDSRNNKLDYCNAGHFPILVFRDDDIYELDIGGGLIGIFFESEYSNGTFNYQDDDCFFLYTDGLLSSLDFKLNDEIKFKEYIKEFFKENNDKSYLEFKESIVKKLMTDVYKQQNDDIAFVIIKNFQKRSKSKKFIFSGEDILNGLHADQITQFIKNNSNINKNEVYDFTYALREIINNAYVYGYKREKDGKIHVKIFIKDDNTFEGFVQDYGEGFSFKEYEVPYFGSEHGILRISGRGIYIVKSLMDDIWVASIKGRGTQFIVQKKWLNYESDTR